MIEDIKTIVTDVRLLLILFLYTICNIMGYSSTSKIIIVLIILAIALVELPIIFRKGLKWHYSMTILIAFSLWGLLSLLWSIDAEMTINRFESLLVLDCFYIISFNIFAEKKKSIDIITTIIILAGLFMSFYVIAYYGFGNYMAMVMKGVRVGKEITNVNHIGMNATIASCCCLYRLIKDKKIYYLIITILPLIVSFGSASRKVFITYCIMLGGLLVFQKSKSILGFVRKNIRIIIAIIAIIAVMQLPFFSFINERLGDFFNIFKQNQIVDDSTLERKRLIELGIDMWRDHPIGGIGLNGTLSPELEIGTYLHNNYAELLATVGSVGLIIYYSLYISSLVKILTTKGHNITKLFITLLILIILFCDAASVSYYTFSSYIYFILIYTYITKKHEERNEHKI